MTQRFEAYRIKTGDNLGNAGFWNERLKDLDLRLHARELDADTLKAAVDQFQALALSRVNDTLVPILNEAITRLAEIGALFRAESTSEIALAQGPISVVLSPDTRTSYVVTDYVSVTYSEDPTIGFVGQVLDYDRETGLMLLDSVAVSGSGTYASWVIRISAAPAAIASQIGAYTRDEVDALIAINRWVG
jgi:hypothetical protein